MNGASSDHHNQRFKMGTQIRLAKKEMLRNRRKDRRCHTNLLQKPYGVLATADSFSFRLYPCRNWLSGVRFFVRCRTLQKCNETIQRRSRLDDCKTMSAATLKIQCSAVEQALPISHGGKNSFLSIGVGPPERHCPSCDSIVYSRRHRLCGVCGQMLPEDCLFTATEAENVEMLLRIERQRHRAWLKKTAAI